MPTPAVHLYLAQEILQAVPAGCLNGATGDYLLGNIAPDAWSLGGLTRREAHILPIPIPPGKHCADELLALYPHLRASRQLPPAAAAFVAGYMAHLLVDELWYYRIFEPFFSREREGDAPIQRRLLYHNVLRLYCENALQDRVAGELVDALAGSAAQYAFPLFDDAALSAWRDRISAEMRPGASRRSAEVFAARLRAPVEQLLALLCDPAALETEVLGRLPAGLLAAVAADGVDQAARLTQRYLGGAM
jgi:hypothetical protein